ncbi:MAG TPA: hypothetical protein VFG62_21240 [Rhodopila sp.]|nr:hypothetical protein [Rhodopila sp.]
MQESDTASNKDCRENGPRFCHIMKKPISQMAGLFPDCGHPDLVIVRRSPSCADGPGWQEFLMLRRKQQSWSRFKVSGTAMARLDPRLRGTVTARAVKTARNRR